MVLIFVYLIGALAISFLCSVLEAVLLSTPASFISLKAKEGNKTAQLLQNYKTNIDRPVGAILTLNTVAHTIGSAGVGAEATRIFGEAWFGVISIILTLLILVFSEIIPKTIGASYWRHLAMVSTKTIRIIIFITYPLVLLSELITKVFTPKSQQITVNREEVAAMVDVGRDEGVFDETESKVIKSCIRLASVKAKEIMTPAIVTEYSSVDLTLKDFYDQQAWHFSRIPVYGKHKDIIIGYVMKADVLKELSADQDDRKLSDLVRDILTFPEDTSAYKIWEEMLRRREHISVIVDEYGCMRGIVTMEDIVETMTGVEIVDEDDLAVDMQALAREKARLLKEANAKKS